MFWGETDTPLETVERHPVKCFFVNSRYTSGDVNYVLTAFGLLALCFGIARLSIPLLVVGAVCWFQLWRNHRRYRERLFFAVAERDRPPGAGPVYPDRRDP